MKIATVRVIPLNDECEKSEEEAMEYEYPNHEEIEKYLISTEAVLAYEITGNAISLNARTKEDIEEVRDFIQKQVPVLKVGIEWDDWVE